MDGINSFVASLEGKSAAELVDLGKSFSIGSDKTEDELIRGMKCFERAASMGDAEGKYRLGWFYLGVIDSVPEQPEIAARLYSEAYEAGYKYAPGRLGYALLTGYGVEKNEFRAEALLREGADDGDFWALFNLTGLYTDPDSPLYNEDKFFATSKELALSTAAQEDDDYLGYIASAQRNLSDCYLKGIGVAPDFSEAIRWLELAAEHGDSISGERLGKRYMNGDGVPRDGAKAKKIFESIVPFDKYDETAAFAKYYIGVLYETGNGIIQDSAQAETYFKAAVDAGLKCPEAWSKYGTYPVNRSASPEEADYGRALIKRAADAGEESAIKAISRFDGQLPSLEERSRLQSSFEELNDPDLTEDSIDVDQIIDFAYAYWYGVGCPVDHEMAHRQFFMLIDRSSGCSLGGSDKRLAGVLREDTLNGGRNKSGKDAELWDAVTRWDMQVLNDHVHEYLSDDASQQDYSKISQAMFWPDIAANHINNVWAGKIAISIFNIEAAMMDGIGIGDREIRAARAILKWTERYLDEDILNAMSPNARENLLAERQQLKQWDSDAWFYRARGFFRKYQDLDENNPMCAIARQRAIAAVADGYAHGSIAAGALKVPLMMQAMQSDAEMAPVATFAERLLAQGAEAALAEMDRFDNTPSPLFLGDAVLYMAGVGYTGVQGRAKDLDKAHALFEMGAGRGYASNLCGTELGRFSKKLFGGWPYSG